MEDEPKSLRHSPIMRNAIRIALVSLLLGSATAAYAQDQAPPPPPDAQPAPPPADAQAATTAAPEAALWNRNDGKWHFATIGYIFFAGAHGTTTPRDPLSPVKLDLSFGDILKAFKFAFMGAAEVRKDRLVFLGDLMWVHLGESQGLKVRDRNFADVHIDSKTTAITALGGYRVVDKGPVVVDLLVGGRLNGNKQRVDYHGQLLDVSASVSKTWIDPIVAARMLAPLGGKVGMSLYGDIGGFGIGSHLTWQAVGTVNYQINHKMNAGIGWRYFKINYHDNDGFLYNVAQSGPIITLRSDF